MLPLLKEYGVDMIPADSEHSAIFQCLQVRRVEVLLPDGVFRGISGNLLRVHYSAFCLVLLLSFLFLVSFSVWIPRSLPTLRSRILIIEMARTYSVHSNGDRYCSIEF